MNGPVNDTFALRAHLLLDELPVGEVEVPVGEGIEVGPTGRLRVPAPEGAAFLLRARWVGRDKVVVTDLSGAEHALVPGGHLDAAVGRLRVRLGLLPKFALRRSGAADVVFSAALLVVVLALGNLLNHAERLWQITACPVFDVCPGRGGADAVPLDRMLSLLARESELTDDPDEANPPPPPRVELRLDQQLGLPVGTTGTVPVFGGSDAVTPEPVRNTERKRVKRSRPTAAQDAPAKPIARPDELKKRLDAQSNAPSQPTAPPGDEVGDDDAIADQEDPSETQRGVGIRDAAEEAVISEEEMERRLLTEYARRLLRLDPDDVGALGLLAYYAYMGQDYDEAERIYDRLIKLEPEEAGHYNNKALVYKRRGDYVREEGLYRLALALEPGDPVVLNNLAVNLSHQGRFDEALAVMDELDALLPDDAYAALHRAKILAEMGRTDEALKLVQVALVGEPSLGRQHRAEFRQDLRLDPSLRSLRADPRFHAILQEHYGEDNPVPPLSVRPVGRSP